jgi:LacI family transcriptional regulator
VPVSSVEPDYEAKAQHAGDLLDALMRGDKVPPDGVRVPPRGVITRVSTDLRAVSDPRVARALAFIAENYPNPLLSVADVAAAVGVSRRQLERSFREATGCTLREHIVRTRMQEASRLLAAHPRAKSSDIATLVGLAGAGNFFRTFRRFYGTSPRAHRQHPSHPPAVGGEEAAADRGALFTDRLTGAAFGPVAVVQSES